MRAALLSPWRWIIGLIAGGGLILAAGLNDSAQAGHSQSYVFPGSPFNGTWALGGYADPDFHHRPWGGDIATDYYQVQYTRGYFWPWTNYGYGANGGGYGVVASKGTSCSNPNVWAGWAYKINLYNPGGHRGWALFAHVSEYGPYYWMPSDQQFWYVGNTVTWGSTVGWTAYWGSGQGVPPDVPSDQKCYDLSYPSSNHFHVELGQRNGSAWIVGASHYACFYGYSNGQYLYSQDYLGVTGANASTERATC